MADSTGMSKIGATPGKLVLVGVLAIILISVLVFQTGGTDAPAASAEKPKPALRTRPTRPHQRRARRQAVTKASVTQGDLEPSPREARPWSEARLEEVLQYDPFAVPEALAPPEPARRTTTGKDPAAGSQPEAVKKQREQALAALRHQGVQMIFFDEDEQVALLGDRMVRVGDTLDGFRVLAIGPEGITLSEQHTDPN
jgi:hypothetical protein